MKKERRKAKAQIALENLIIRGWSIFLIILILGILIFIISISNSQISSVFNFANQQREIISGNALLSSEIIEASSQVVQNSDLKVSINPSGRGIYKFAYIYDSEDNLKQVFSFDCDDICKEKKETHVFINDSYLGGYYVAVFDYDSDSYVKKSFEVVSGIAENCDLKRAYWEKEQAGDSESVNLILESENCEGKQAVFSIYRKDWIFDNFIENISDVIVSGKTIVSWKSEFTNLFFGNPKYYFRVKVNPEIISENELVVLEGENLKQPAIGFKDEGWYSWAKDSSNSRIADDEVVPPFSVKWSALYPGSDTNNFLHLTRLLYQDGRLFVVMARHNGHGAGFIAYNATNGDSLWNNQIGGVQGNIGLFVLSNGYIFGGYDHNNQIMADVETGELKYGYNGARDGYANADESGVYSNGVPCTDCYSVKLEPLIPIYKPRYEITSDARFGNALHFPPYPGYYFNSSDYLSLGNVLNPGTDDLTIMFWFKWDGSESVSRIVAKGNPDDYSSTLYSVSLSGGNKTYKNVYYTLGEGYDYFYGGDVFTCNKNEWCHFALTYDHQKERLYKNGILVFERENSANIGSDSEPLYIGGFREAAGFHGNLDEFVMFNRALSEEEIQQKYNSEIVADASTQLLLHFNNDSAYRESEEFFYDYSENGNNAIYDGHMNFYSPWGYSVGKMGTGINTPWYGGDGGLGQLALSNGIVYLPNGILWARNETTGEVIWKNGTYPVVRWKINSELPEDLLDIGDVVHFSEATYSDGKIYVFGRECFATSNSVRVYIDTGVEVTVNETLCTSWSVPCLYSYAALTGQRLGKICLDENYAVLDKYPNSILGGKFPGRGFETIIDNDVAFVSTVSQVLALNIATGEKIWEYNRPVRLTLECSQGIETVGCTYDIEDDPFDIGDIVLSGNYLFTLEPFDNTMITLDKNTGEKTGMFKSDYIWLLAGVKQVEGEQVSANHWDRLTGLAIVDNMVFVSSEHGRIFALEPIYTQPEITNKETKLPEGIAGYAYKGKQLHSKGENYTFIVRNGEWGYNWEIVSGRLPNGLKLENDSDSYFSVLSGIPTEPGDFDFTLRVTDARGNSDEKEFSLKIIPDVTELSITLQEGMNEYTGCEDSYIYGFSTNADKNFGNESFLSLYNPDVNQRALIKFKIFKSEGGPLPDDALITDAKLTLIKANSIGGRGKVYSLLKSWDENSVTWKNTTSNELWEVPGASGIYSDRSILFANFSMTGDRESCIKPGVCFIVHNYVEIFDLNKLFEETTPETNNGVLVELDSGYVNMFSSEYFNESEADNGLSKRPKLELKYKRFNFTNILPVARIYANPTKIKYPELTVLNASESYDLDGEIAGYNWINQYNGGRIETMYCKNFNQSTPWLCSLQQGLNVILEVYDDAGTIGRTGINITSFISGFAITTTMLRDGRVNQGYSDYVYAGGNTSKTTWSLASGSLPNGLTLNSNTGEISGISTQEGIYNFQIQVSAQNTVTQDLRIEILSESGETETSTIYQCGTLDYPGLYVLNQSITDITGTCFTISANDITLDLNNYNLTGDCTGNAVYVSGYNQTTIKNGGIYNFYDGIWLKSSSKNTITNIKANDMCSSGVFLSSSSNNNVITNIIANSNTYFGVYLYSGPSNNILTNITANRNVERGIYLYKNSNNNRLTNITANGGTQERGIQLLSNSNNNILTNIIADNNIFYGIELSSSSNNILTDGSVFNSSGFYDVNLVVNSINNTFLNISYSVGRESVDSGSQLIRKWHYRAYVNDSAGNNVANANVTAYNSSNSHQFNLTTGADGYTQLGQIIDYVNIGGTRTYYSPYTIYAQHIGYPTISHAYDVATNKNNLHDAFTLRENGEIHTCLDGTSYGQCSLIKPKFCDNGTLIDDCSVCGCLSGSCLENGSCELQGEICGNSIVESGEVCDGNALDDETCESQGFDSGTLGCSEDCSGFDTSGCVLECELTSAYWSTTESIEGERVTLSVEGINCDGKTASFQVWEDDLVGDDLANLQPSNSVFVSGKAETTWTAEYSADPFVDPNPEYYFIVSSEGKTRTSGLMSVSPSTSPCVDVDNDGYNATARGICGNLADCNDNNPSVHPGAFELCNGIDDNCINGADETNGECSGTMAICSGGRCVECVNDAQCSDSLYCDGIETCDVNGICGSGFLNLSDNIMCTIDSCEEENDKIVNTPNNASCNNGLYCDGTGYCNIVLKKCEQINPPVCNDGISCTLDSCSEGVSLIDNLGSCVVDTSPCACAKNSDCDDNNICTDNSCTGQLTCLQTFNTKLCDDNLFCTENDKCAFGNCAGTQKNVSDGISCTIDLCSEAGKNISHVGDSSFCNNGLYCDGIEICDVLADCQPGTPPTEDDGYVCTIESCNEAIDDFNHVPDDSLCDDGKYCTIDLCVGSKSYDGCSHPVRDCSDGNSNTYDYCNETLKTCKNDIIIHDEDGDGVPDEFDKCPGTPLNIVSAVSNKDGCPIPIYTKFNIITNLTNIDLWNVSDFEIGIRGYGEIRYSKKNLSLIVPPTGGGGGFGGGSGSYNGSNYSRINFDSGINISQYKIELDSSNLPQMNKSAEIIFFNISFISPKILRNNQNCTECQIILWNKNLSRLEFSVPHFTSYEVVEGYDSCGNLSCDAGETCSNCPVDCGNCPTTPNSGNNGGGGGGGSGTPAAKPGCLENWSCGGWQNCILGFRTRACEDKNNCGTENIKPAVKEACEVEKAGEPQSELAKGASRIISQIDIKIVIIVAVVLILAVFIVIFVVRKIKAKQGILRLKKKIEDIE